MAKKCVACGKKPVIGLAVSRSNRRTKRTWNPNLQKVNLLIAGRIRKQYICTKCLKSGQVTKAPPRA